MSRLVFPHVDALALGIWAAVGAQKTLLAGRPADGLVIGTAVGAVLCPLARWRGWILPEEITWRPLGRRRSKSSAG